MFDDAQEIYEHRNFWRFLIKVLPTFERLKSLRFIISATHSLEGGKESPVEFDWLPQLDRSDFLLNDQDAKRVLQLPPPTGLPSHLSLPRLQTIMIRECGGLIGALKISVDWLANKFEKVFDGKETEFIRYYLSGGILKPIARCFGSAHSPATEQLLKAVINRCLTEEPVNERAIDLSPEVQTETRSLLKSGILAYQNDGCTLQFSSPLALKYYLNHFFPKRSLTNPVSIHSLVSAVIKSMSASVLQQSIVNGFPKEATFQHLFMGGLTRFTKPYCAVCPELAKVFPRPNEPEEDVRISGEIDFYLDGELRWGIELLINGDGIKEHISRFGPGGKYYDLSLTDYVVVDIRGNATGETTNIQRDPHRITVFFKRGDFSSCKCIFGMSEEPIIIQLKN
jgi:hypothetical protein